MLSPPDAEIPMLRRFAREIGSLKPIFDFAAEFAGIAKLARGDRMVAELVLEELFTNMLKYNRGGGKEIAIEMARSGDRLTLKIRDFDVEEFDVTRAREVDVTRPLDERKPGGLGLHLIRRLVDDVAYDYADRCSTITVTKRLEASDARD
jgi:anti-sigma regulatory factor (Ser/Thr protein kinase)